MSKCLVGYASHPGWRGGGAPHPEEPQKVASTPFALQMPAPTLKALASGVGEGEAAAKVAASPGPLLSTRKATSLDVHVPSLRSKPAGVWGRMGAEAELAWQE